jgi:hypothetical protein
LRLKVYGAAKLPILLLFAAIGPLAGQVSPGPLSKAHRSLDGTLKCASCHVFGTGSPKLKCLDCHTEIRALVRQHESYHGRVVDRAKGDQDCVRCHTEHYGEDFRIYKWETSREEFDHRQTGYPLLGRHSSLHCEQCHNAKHISQADRPHIKVKDLSRTFEGLHPACLTCHVDRHAGQLGADCEKCHSVNGWKPLKSFDHSTTHFPLTGKHADVECAKCHRPEANNAKVIKYTGLSFAACTGCHQDPHRGAFAARCEGCHNTEVWKQVRTSNGFDHATTKFPLDGKHREVACLKCHKDANFKTPVAHQKCLDCHKDQHKSQFLGRKDGGDCGACHALTGWRPSTFTEASHKATAYPLTGKHQALACAKCHAPAPAPADTNYHPRFQACLDCHKDPHAGQFSAAPRANRCEGCHTVNGFRPATFGIGDHQSSRFALKGAHAAVACQDCHGKGRRDDDWQFRFPNLACAGCHQNPHEGLTEATAAEPVTAQDVCESCHGLASWRRLKSFDHAKAGFPLTGAHQALGCLDCHRPLDPDARPRQIPFKAASRKCAGCHEDIHGGQFRSGDTVDCARCHTTSHWPASVFDHEKESTFSLRGAHKDVPCRLCHKARQSAAGRTIAMYKGTPRECASCHR